MVSTRSMALAVGQKVTAMAAKSNPPVQMESVAAKKQAASAQNGEAQQPQRDLSSGEKVFDVVELAEMILCQLSLGDISTMQRVCRRCHDTIRTSKTVQKGLCVFSNSGAPCSLVFRFRSANGQGDAYFRLQYVTWRKNNTFDINFEMLTPEQGHALCHPDNPTHQKPITILEGSEARDELWCKVRWVEKGFKRGGSIWLEKKTPTGEFIWASRSLSEAATLGEMWELLREMEGDKLIC